MADIYIYSENGTTVHNIKLSEEVDTKLAQIESAMDIELTAELLSTGEVSVTIQNPYDMFDYAMRIAKHTPSAIISSIEEMILDFDVPAAQEMYDRRNDDEMEEWVLDDDMA